MCEAGKTLAANSKDGVGFVAVHAGKIRHKNVSVFMSLCIDTLKMFG